MPQIKVDTSGYEMKNLRKAATKAFDTVVSKGRYRIYYSIFTHEVHIIGPVEEPDPDWLLCEDWTPYAMGQQAIADVIADKLQKLQSQVSSSGLQKLVDES